MKQEEKLLFKELCKFKNEKLDQELLSYATPNVLGYLFFNRMQGVAYHMLSRNNLLANVNREFRNSLRDAYEQNCERNNSFFRCVAQIACILASCDCKAAMLKGAWLFAHYPKGCRTSNDIDLLVLPKDVTTIGDLLTDSGFQQGTIWNGKFTPATRREIIESKMMRGETVPYIEEVNLPGMKYLEVDINFSLDYKNGNTDLLSVILSRATFRETQSLHIPTLSQEDFFIHLCAHLYKEATTLPWIEMRRDMTFYKYCDIYLLLSEMAEEDLDVLFDRAEELGMDKICAYAILETAGLFDMQDTKAFHKATEILTEDPAFLRRVVSPKDKKLFIYQTADVTERFFMNERALDLKELKPYETN